MKQQFKLISMSAILIALNACSSLDTTGAEIADQYGVVNEDGDENVGYIYENGQIIRILPDGSREVVTEEEILAIDANNDGIPDFDRNQDGVIDITLDEVLADTDGDGILNVVDTDIDGDGIDNALDTDIDGDGIENIDDADIDGDGVANTDDLDIDGDGILNDVDSDIDGDGVANTNDNDIDGDGIDNEVDTDVDGDGTDNSVDTDIDGDGQSNSVDDDIDGDGIPNDIDPDMDGDGILNEVDPDVDGDGVLNEQDTDEDVDGNLAVLASNSQSVAVEILQGSTGDQTNDVINIQDIRDEIAAESIELATVQISNFAISISGQDAAAFQAGMSSSLLTLEVLTPTGVLVTSAPNLTVADLVGGASIANGKLIVMPAEKQFIENTVKDTSAAGSISIVIDFGLGQAAPATYNFNVDLEVTASGKKEL